MKKILEQVIRRRNPNFRFDDELNCCVLLQFTMIQAMSFLRGCRLLLYGRASKGALLGRGVRFFNLPYICFGKFMKLGAGVYISALSKEGIQMGNNVSIGAYSRIIVSTSFNDIGLFIKIGHNVGIGEFAYLGGAGGLTIGNDCIVGQYFSCHPENHNFDNLDLPIRHQGVTRKGIKIGNNCWIGSKVTILDGVEIGDGCVIAAGAVVQTSFPPNSVIGGVPARILKQRNASN
jgi:acetyltransferase-like isoleucine patch superfamily enzyme